MSKTGIIILVLIIIVIGVIFWLSGKTAKAPIDNISPPATVTSEPATNPVVNSNTVQEYTINGRDFEFSPAFISANKGDTVRITFKNFGGTHDFKIDEYNVATKRISNDQSETIEFTADKIGTFKYYCSVGQHRAMGMEGTLMVVGD
ncbi:MAG TPA: cupredoxin domain-containing protein [Candidatus Paceibacterota bacterium]